MRSNCCRRPIVVLTVLLMLLGAVQPALASAQALPIEHWYTLHLRDIHCGWMRSLVEQDGENLRGVTETFLRIDRAGQTVSIALRSESIERRDGHPVRLTVRTEMGGAPTESVWEFPARRGEPVTTIVRQGDRERRSTEPWPAGEWLAPIAAERFFAERRAAGAKEVVYDSIDGQSGLRSARVTARFDGEERAEFEGRPIPATRWRVTTSLLPVESVSVFSSDGVVLSGSTMLGADPLRTRLSTRAEATALPGAAVEMIVATMVVPDRRIPGVARTRNIDYRLSVPDGELMDLPSAGAQRFERLDPGSALVRVRVDEPRAAPLEDATAAGYREPSTLIESDDPVVRELVERALRGDGDAEDPRRRAERLRRFVHEHVRGKDLATAFASAAETARSREGDCSEHAVLLAAMLRAAGIPSRVAVGLVYVDRFGTSRHVFGWHMWTQALLPLAEPGTTAADDPAAPQAWIDLDATLPGGRAYHAGHLLAATTDLSAGLLDPALASVVPLLGRLRVEVVEIDGTTGRPDPTERGQADE